MSPARSASAVASPAYDAARHREVDALQPDAGGEAQRRGVAGDEHAVAGHLRHHRQAGLGDEVGRVLLDLAALDERGDRRVGLELGDDLLGPPLLGGQLGQLEHDADGDVSRFV